MYVCDGGWRIALGSLRGIFSNSSLGFRFMKVAGIVGRAWVSDSDRFG